MKTFDMHADIGTDLYHRTLKGESDILNRIHLPNLNKGDVKGVFTACFFDGHEDYKTMQDMVLNCNDLLEKQEGIRFVKSKKDLVVDDKTLAIISVEGMCGIKDNVEEKIEWLFKHNVKVASLVWNEKNALACGWKLDPMYGLSELGFKVVKKMNEIGMIIDVSHINEKGFWDVISSSSKPIIATHSNCRKLCNHERNLTDQQIKAIALKGGLVGLNACGSFINDERSKQDALNLARHGRYIADLVGVKHLGCGFDYMNFLSEDGLEKMAIDLKDASYTQNLVKGLLEVGFNEKEVEDIMFNNVYNFLSQYLV